MPYYHKEAGPTAVTVGPYTICQRVAKDPRSPKGHSAILTVDDEWVLPGGVVVTTAELTQLAERNGWRVG